MMKMLVLPNNLKDKLSKSIMNEMDKYLETKKYKVFYFGSRVTGKCHERSDIDIGILGPKKIPLEIIQKIEDRLRELPTLLKIEVVDFHDMSKDFKEVSLSQIELINQND